MQRSLHALQAASFDLLVVGGGISGACLAHDAALRGLSVALIDRGDFGSATSAASSKLLHGGIRYLQGARLDKARESALERAYFQRMAPHLTRWVPFLVPTHRGWLRGRPLLAAGLAIQRVLSVGERRAMGHPSKQAPAGRYYPADELGTLVPALAGHREVTGAYSLYESHMYSSERMTLGFLKTAARHGATVANYVALEQLRRSGPRVTGAVVRDMIGDDRFEIAARVVANAAGPWLAGLNEALGLRPLRRAVTGFSKGAHLVTRQIEPRFALALPTARQSSALLDRGGRHVFVIPWRGHSLVGTSDAPFEGSPDRVAPTEDDVRNLLDDVNAALGGARLERRDVRHAYAGLYPLTASELDPERYQGTGDYQVVDHARAGECEGFVSVLGAKYTTARKLADRATTVVCRQLGRAVPRCRTHVTPIVGGEITDLEAFAATRIERYRDCHEADVVTHLVRSYGTEIDAVIDTRLAGDRLGFRLTDARETIGAEVAYAVLDEMALTLSDVVFRRTGLGTVGHPGSSCLEQCAQLMGTVLGWSATERAAQIRATEAQFAIAPPEPGPAS